MMEDFVGIGIVAAVPFFRSVRKGASEIIVSAPQVLLAPKINGVQKEGETLTATQGFWDDGGSPITSFSYNWLRNGVPITGAETSSYNITSDDVDNTLRVQVIATNDVGIGVGQSDPTGAIVPADHAPISVDRPTIAGIARSEEILAASSNGTWEGNGDELLDFAYQWLGDEAVLPGETGTTIHLHDQHIGMRISLRVTATNSIGSTDRESLQTAAVVAAQFYPGIVSAPEISGIAKVGARTWTVSDGVWNNGNSTITGYAYQWYADGVAIAGATSNTLSADDDTYAGKTITCDVTATNSIGSTTATSTDFGPIEARVIAPVNQSLPTVSGTPKYGNTLSVDNGTWYDGGAAITYSYQWYRSDGTTVAISGATSSTYDLASADVGEFIFCIVTATNSAGSTSESSAYTPAISSADAPNNTVRPAITGDAFIGGVLSASQGTWDDKGVAITGYTYQWLADGVEIVGATTNTYTCAAGDLGKRLTVKVTATNAGGSTTIASLPTPAITKAPITENFEIDYAILAPNASIQADFSIVYGIEAPAGPVTANFEIDYAIAA